MKRFLSLFLFFTFSQQVIAFNDDVFSELCAYDIKTKKIWIRKGVQAALHIKADGEEERVERTNWAYTHEYFDNITASMTPFPPHLFFEATKEDGSTMVRRFSHKDVPLLTPRTHLRGISFSITASKDERCTLFTLIEEGYSCFDVEDCFNLYSRHRHVPTQKKTTKAYTEKIFVEYKYDEQKAFYFFLPIYEFCQALNPQRGKSLHLLNHKENVAPQPKEVNPRPKNVNPQRTVLEYETSL